MMGGGLGRDVSVGGSGRPFTGKMDDDPSARGWLGLRGNKTGADVVCVYLDFWVELDIFIITGGALG